MIQPSTSKHRRLCSTRIIMYALALLFTAAFLLFGGYATTRTIVASSTCPENGGVHNEDVQHVKEILVPSHEEEEDHHCDCVSSPPIVFPLNEAHHYFVAWKVNNDVHWSVQTYFPQDALTVKDLTALLTAPLIDHINHVMSSLNGSGIYKDGIDSVCTKHEQCAVTRFFPLSNHHEVVFAKMEPPVHRSTGSESILWETRPSVLTYSDWKRLSANETLPFITSALRIL